MDSESFDPQKAEQEEKEREKNKNILSLALFIEKDPAEKMKILERLIQLYDYCCFEDVYYVVGLLADHQDSALGTLQMKEAAEKHLEICSSFIDRLEGTFPEAEGTLLLLSGVDECRLEKWDDARSSMEKSIKRIEACKQDTDYLSVYVHVFYQEVLTVIAGFGEIDLSYLKFAMNLIKNRGITEIPKEGCSSIVLHLADTLLNYCAEEKNVAFWKEAIDFLHFVIDKKLLEESGQIKLRLQFSENEYKIALGKFYDAEERLAEQDEMPEDETEKDDNKTYDRKKDSEIRLLKLTNWYGTYLSEGDAESFCRLFFEKRKTAEEWLKDCPVLCEARERYYSFLFSALTQADESFLKPEGTETVAVDIKGFVDVPAVCRTLDAMLFNGTYAPYSGFLLFASDILMGIASLRLVDENRIRVWKECLEGRLKDKHFNGMTQSQMASCLFNIYMVSKYLKLPGRNYIEEAFKAIQESRDNNRNQLMLIFTAAYAEELIKNQQSSVAVEILSRQLRKTDDRISEALRYKDDRRLINILRFTQLSFLQSYTILRRFLTDKRLYEYILQYKNAASRAGRERNWMINKNPEIKSLSDEIDLLYQKRSRTKTDNLYLDIQPEAEENSLLENRIRYLEKEFFENFKAEPLMSVSVDELSDSLPEGSAVIEYVLFQNVFSDQAYLKANVTDDFRMNDSGTENFGIDVFVSEKKNGKFAVFRKALQLSETLLEQADNYLDAMQNGESYEPVAEKIELYQWLIEPIRPILSDVSVLYISPLGFLEFIPYTLLGKDKNDRLEDFYKIMYIESGRDLMGRKYPDCGSGALVMGNPSFELEPKKSRDQEKGPDRGAAGSSEHRYIIDAEDIMSLPYSADEAERIAGYMGESPLIGRDAVKYALLNSHGKRYLHISTHGYCDLDNDLLYTSAMLFAGAKTYLRTGRTDRRFGNGIVTADEVSRMDLNSVELVTLSTCYSGLQLSKDFAGPVLGLRSSFAAAGVRYIVACLWEADDMAAAVLSDFMYQEIKGGTDIPEALNRAKRYVRNVTIRELREKNWKIPPGMEGKYPFRNVWYWGGFICQRCR